MDMTDCFDPRLLVVILIVDCVVVCFGSEDTDHCTVVLVLYFKRSVIRLFTLSFINVI